MTRDQFIDKMLDLLEQVRDARLIDGKPVPSTGLLLRQMRELVEGADPWELVGVDVVAQAQRKRYEREQKSFAK